MVNKKQDTANANKVVNPVIAGVAGAVVGAGVAVAASQAMKDEKTKEKVKEVLHTVKDQAMEYVDTLNTRVAGQKGEKKIADQLEKGKEELKQKLSHPTKDHQTKDQ